MSRRVALVLIPGLALFISGATGTLVAAAPPRPPAKAPAATPMALPGTPVTKSCLKCHGDLQKERYVHGPVVVGACLACHTPVDEKTMNDPERHQFTLAKEEREICYTCHERRLDTEKVVHGPVRFGLCTACHDPHQSPYRYRLKASPPGKLCFQCHIQDKTREKEVHGPVAVGECVACHDPHTSPYEYRLIAAGPDLCYTCHTEKKAEFSGRRFAHPPAKADCSNCHDPHASPVQYRLHRKVPDLCFGCHPDKKDHVFSVKTEHDAYKIEKKCLNCHDPHFTDYPKQLRDVPKNLCLRCHNKELPTPTGQIINMHKWLDENHDWHGPIRQGDCPACHNPHGTDNFRMLKKPFPRQFYTGFALEKYALCFRCHERTLVLDRYTTTLTNFRNGDQNLHFHHVNRTTKGRTCRACHELHASNNPKHIRDSVPFGAWDLPTNFVKYKNGGKCAPGCHVPRGYNRVKPVKNPIDYATFTAD
ncbi:MAG: cytochrome c3 family protein [Candidatus Methylomirabilales bacterium]